MRHDETWKLETEPRQDTQVSRLSQKRDIKHHVSRQLGSMVSSYSRKDYRLKLSSDGVSRQDMPRNSITEEF